jgi:hypothetical protein
VNIILIYQEKYQTEGEKKMDASQWKKHPKSGNYSDTD